MASDDDRERPKGTTSGAHARNWVQAKLVSEALQSALSDEEPRQLTIRLNPVVAALFEALSARLGVTRNNAANLLLGAALVEAVSGLCTAERSALLKEVEKSLGRGLDLTPPPEPPGVFRGVLDDMGAIVEEIKALFR